eukprot:10223330-Lingulodinium_polyedra.AAC.1
MEGVGRVAAPGATVPGAWQKRVARGRRRFISWVSSSPSPGVGRWARGERASLARPSVAAPQVPLAGPRRARVRAAQGFVGRAP